jgi:hypothetical protein
MMAQPLDGALFSLVLIPIPFPYPSDLIVAPERSTVVGDFTEPVGPAARRQKKEDEFPIFAQIAAASAALAILGAGVLLEY